MPPITCHILDTTLGQPAANVECDIRVLKDTFEHFATARTNSDGRVAEWVPKASDGKLLKSVGFENNQWTGLASGVYQIRFHTKNYFLERDGKTFFPFIDITFEVPNPPDNHYHVPLLLSNYGYSTYRGS
ncbi:uncharacterized protein OGAPODRAFT_93790 [Ogataea polymorpha]|uniref:uncharacterized protein n=1 Tax=Ogataea polymorpha TaxID=460523 RepID=UPI0007F3C228|nr:uncharacterized protein OGAPODRAFT_93790 [Ogataea polymorpha]OBA16849.1 hypothetical protein OGAPODRAFT_93790 [Ogataea polymorpha]